MTMLDQIRLGGESAQKAEALCRGCKFNPTEIGIQILRALGYEVKEYLKGDISVTDPKTGKLLYFLDLPDYEP